MKKLIIIPILFAAAHAFAISTPVRVTPFETVVISSVAPPNGSAVSWRSSLVPMYHATFQNISNTDVYLATYAITSPIGSFSILLSTKNAYGSTWDFQINGNPTWYLYGNGANADVRIIQFK